MYVLLSKLHHHHIFSNNTFFLVKTKSSNRGEPNNVLYLLFVFKTIKIMEDDRKVRMLNGLTVMGALAHLENKATKNELCEHIATLTGHPDELVSAEIHEILTFGVRNGFLIKIGKNYSPLSLKNTYQEDKGTFREEESFEEEYDEDEEVEDEEGEYEDSDEEVEEPPDIVTSKKEFADCVRSIYRTNPFFNFQGVLDQILSGNDVTEIRDEAMEKWIACIQIIIERIGQFDFSEFLDDLLFGLSFT